MSDFPGADVPAAARALPSAVVDVRGESLTPVPATISPCPDCRDGKHGNCAEFAFDADDNEVPCPCEQHSHGA
jgi:hypothetical protein